MKKLLLVLFLLCGFSAAQTATVTGNVKTLGTTVNTSGVKIRFELRSNTNSGVTQLGCGPGIVPRVTGTTAFVDTYYEDFAINSSTGALTGSIYRNDYVNCAGLTPTYYWVYVVKDGAKKYYGQFCVNSSSFNLNSASECSAPAIGNVSIYAPAIRIYSDTNTTPRSTTGELAIVTIPAGSLRVGSVIELTTTIVSTISGATGGLNVVSGASTLWFTNFSVNPTTLSYRAIGIVTSSTNILWQYQVVTLAGTDTFSGGRFNEADIIANDILIEITTSVASGTPTITPGGLVVRVQY